MLGVITSRVLEETGWRREGPSGRIWGGGGGG